MHPLGVVGAVGEGAIERLARRLDGDVVLPDDEAYDGRRDVWNGLVNRYPAVVVRVADAEDVAAGIEFAREHDLPLSVRAGAHEQSGRAIAENGVVLDLGRLDHVRIDPDDRVAEVGPGNTTADALAATQEHGLAFPTGSAGAPGVSGTTLGGGIGWIRRKHGLAVDALRSVELVTADGAVRHLSAADDPDLFWGVRGAGHGLGVVTNFEFDCYEVGPTVGGLSVFYPWEAADEVFAAVRGFVADAPPAATIICNYAEIPAVPGMPPALHGEAAVALVGCYAGDPETGMEVFEPLRTVTDPLVDNSEPIPYETLHEMGTLLHPWGRKYVHRSAFVDELTDGLHGLLVDRVEAAPGPMDGVGIWPMGGAVEDGPDTAYAWSDAGHLVVVEAAWESHDSPAHLAWARETDRALRERGADGAYVGYLGVEEQPGESWAERAYDGRLARLRALKREYDPDGVFGDDVID
jgi:FAD/FMN-containing dehydrogenase